MKQVKKFNPNGNRKPRADLVLLVDPMNLKRESPSPEDAKLAMREFLFNGSNKKNDDMVGHYLKDKNDLLKLKELASNFSKTKKENYEILFLFDNYQRKIKAFKTSIYIIKKSNLMKRSDILESLNLSFFYKDSESDFIWLSKDCYFEEDQVFNNNPAYIKSNSLSNQVFKVFNLKEAEYLKKSGLKEVSLEEVKEKKYSVLVLNTKAYDFKNDKKNVDYKLVSSEDEKHEIVIKMETIEGFYQKEKMPLTLKGENINLKELEYGVYNAYVEPLKRTMLLKVSNNIIYGEEEKVAYLEDYKLGYFKTLGSGNV